MGGEKVALLLILPLTRGSPPHGRGKVFFFTDVNVYKGITPAWAGKSHLGAVLIVAGKDHPRMGGEKLLVLLSVGWWLGSPPHGRGKAF